MSPDSVWMIGHTRSGKTTRLIELFCAYTSLLPQAQNVPSTAPTALIFAANGDNRMDLADRIVTATAGEYAVQTTTPLGFFLDEVFLFWPLLIGKLNVRAQFPIRLRSETEQELATQLWRTELDGPLQQEGVSEYRMVRRTLDLLTLAASSGIAIEQIPEILERGLSETGGTPQLWQCMGEVLLRWRDWCLERGLLTYGLISELYWRHLLPHETYQKHLKQRYRLVFADDVDEYPAIASFLFDLLLENNAVGVFTYNPAGGIRLGLGADPKYLGQLASRCRVETLAEQPTNGLAKDWGKVCVERTLSPMWSDSVALPSPQVQSLETVSRSQLLRQTAETLVAAVQAGEVEPQEIAIIAPGLDAIARYTLLEILGKAGISVEPLNDQRPLVNYPPIRALLTLMALVYPGLGRLVDREAIAEMFVVLSQKPITHEQLTTFTPDIDPVRAGLLADHCYAPSPDRPRLLPYTTFPRWDRLGHQATTAYAGILQWIEAQQGQLQDRLIPSPIVFLDRAIQRFLWSGSNLPYDQLAAIRELMETAQHYWEVQKRLKAENRTKDAIATFDTVGQFIELLQRGTISANPYPVRAIGPARRAVTLATIFQYRSSRRSHRWHFWLDASSPLWLSGGAATLFGAPLFLQDRIGRPLTLEDTFAADEKRLQRILLDLLGRVEERLYLCHSDLAVSGQEQTGPLLPLVHAAG